MGITFRSGEYQRSVFLGKRTIKDGEAAAIWNVRGVHREIIGPRRVWMYSSLIRFLNRHKAEAHQYLHVGHRDGRVEYIRGPASIYENPALHDTISVRDGIRLKSDSECIIVYKSGTELSSEEQEVVVAKTFSGPVQVINEAGKSQDSIPGKRLILGPNLFFPEVGEWVHEFQWSGTKGGSELLRQINKFNVLHRNKNRTWKVDLPLMTSDSISFHANLVFNYHMESLDLCTLSIDPIEKMYSALMADAQEIGNSVASKQLRTAQKEVMSGLSSLQSYPLLRDAAESAGFSVDSVLITGMIFCGRLQQQADSEQKHAANLHAELVAKTQQRKLDELELENRRNKIEQEAELQRKAVEVKAKLEGETHAMKEAAVERKLALEQKEMEAKQKLIEKHDATVVQFLKALKEGGVDMTKFMCTVGGMNIADEILSRAPSLNYEAGKLHQKSVGQHGDRSLSNASTLE